MHIQNLIQNLENKPSNIQAGLLFLTLAPLYYVSYLYRVAHPYTTTNQSTSTRPPISDFSGFWLNTQIVSPFNPSPIAAFCKRTQWHPNLIFNLDNANGGIGNVRGNILDFVFFAIEAGASIVLPGMATRSQEDLSNVWSSRAEFDAFFDEEWFVATMANVCPRMGIYKSGKHTELPVPLPGNYLPRNRRLDQDEKNTKEAYLEHLNAWLKSQPQYSPDNVTLVNLERTLWEIDTRSLPRGLRRNFGHLLRIKPSLRRTAALVVQNLAKKHIPLLDPRDGIPRKAFYGAHLRTESDASAAGWLDDKSLTFPAQTDTYIAEAIHHDLEIIYAASGNSTELARFKAKAAAHRPPLNVVSKSDLLSSPEATSLRALPWDQQALVDYEVLHRCSVFGGITKSSFSYNIALTRNQRLEDLGRPMDPWVVLIEEEGVGFDDAVSRLAGRDAVHEARVPRGMWP